MAGDRTGAYSEVESLKKGKHKIAKDYRRNELLLSLVFAFIICFLFNYNELFSKDTFFFSIFDYAKAINGEYKGGLNYWLFLPFMLLTYFVAYLFVDGKLLERFKNIKIVKFIFDLPFKIIGYIFYIPKDLYNTMGYEAFYLRKLEKNFFYQVVEKEDGYKRVDKLTIFNDRKYLFGNEYNRIFSLFRSKEHFDDLFLIIEGYLYKSHLFDKVIYKNDEDIFPESYINKINSDPKNKGNTIPENRNYKYFQTYMLRENKDGVLEDSVVLSLNAIRIYMEDKKSRFRDFLENEAFDFRTAVSSPKKEFAKRFYALAKDVHFREKITKSLDKEEAQRVLKTLDATASKSSGGRTRGNNNRKISIFQDKKTLGYLIEMLMADFTLILFKIVINQFMNVPAGMMVVKIEDYDTRMIIEYYKQLSTIEIVEKKNDGQSKLFKSDNYVNLFLLMFAYFINDKENNVFSELYFRFNTAEYNKPLSFSELKKLIDNESEEGVLKKQEEYDNIQKTRSSKSIEIIEQNKNDLDVSAAS